MLDFEAFSARAKEIAASIPAEFLQGIESVDVHREAKRHPFLADVYTLGECATSPLSDPTGQDPFRSTVHLYHGSFVALAKEDPGFDVEHELQETIEHEIQHHLEDRAGLATLRNEDDLFDAHARFRAGLELPPGWYRHGERVAPGLWAVDLDLFLELELRRQEWEALLGTTVTLDVMGEPLEFEVPADASPDEAFTLEGEGLFEGEAEAPEEEGSGEDVDDDEDEDAGDEGKDGDERSDDDEVVGYSGDLHVIPVVR